jgi:hypothetical protein
LIFLPVMPAGNVLVFESGSEEVANRNFHARVGFTVPIHPQYQFAEMKRTGRVDREPHVTDGARAFYLSKRDFGIRLDFNPICITARGVSTRNPLGNRVAEGGESA